MVIFCQCIAGVWLEEVISDRDFTGFLYFLLGSTLQEISEVLQNEHVLAGTELIYSGIDHKSIHLDRFQCFQFLLQQIILLGQPFMYSNIHFMDWWICSINWIPTQALRPNHSHSSRFNEPCSMIQIDRIFSSPCCSWNSWEGVHIRHHVESRRWRKYHKNNHEEWLDSIPEKSNWLCTIHLIHSYTTYNVACNQPY